MRCSTYLDIVILVICICYFSIHNTYVYHNFKYLPVLAYQKLQFNQVFTCELALSRGSVRGDIIKPPCFQLQIILFIYIHSLFHFNISLPIGNTHTRHKESCTKNLGNKPTNSSPLYLFAVCGRDSQTQPFTHKHLYTYNKYNYLPTRAECLPATTH